MKIVKQILGIIVGMAFIRAGIIFFYRIKNSDRDSS